MSCDSGYLPVCRSSRSNTSGVQLVEVRGRFGTGSYQYIASEPVHSLPKIPLDKSAGIEYTCPMSWIEGEVVDAVWERRSSVRATRRRGDNVTLVALLFAASLGWFTVGMIVGMWIR